MGRNLLQMLKGKHGAKLTLKTAFVVTVEVVFKTCMTSAGKLANRYTAPPHEFFLHFMLVYGQQYHMSKFKTDLMSYWLATQPH